jgi:hypothetical protein
MISRASDKMSSICSSIAALSPIAPYRALNEKHLLSISATSSNHGTCTPRSDSSSARTSSRGTGTVWALRPVPSWRQMEMACQAGVRVPQFGQCRSMRDARLAPQGQWTHADLLISFQPGSTRHAAAGSTKNLVTTRNDPRPPRTNVTASRIRATPPTLIRQSFPGVPPIASGRALRINVRTFELPNQSEG